MKKTKTQVIKFLLFFVTIIFLINPGCTKSGTDPRDENIILPDSNLTFNDHIYPLFLLKCGSRDGCHSFINPARNLILIDYNTLMNHFIQNAPSEPLVRIGEGENSPLYLVLIQYGYLGIPRMPRDGPYLTANQVGGIREWINEGAKLSAKK